MINFKGIKQLTKQAFLNLSDEDKKGYFCLVRDGECETDGSLKDENVTNEEIYFGGRKYAETSHRKMFIGTQEEYDTAYAEGNIATGALVVILDGSETEEGGATISALLGTGILGKMLLGQK